MDRFQWGKFSIHLFGNKNDRDGHKWVFVKNSSKIGWHHKNDHNSKNKNRKNLKVCFSFYTVNSESFMLIWKISKKNWNFGPKIVNKKNIFSLLAILSCHCFGCYLFAWIRFFLRSLLHSFTIILSGFEAWVCCAFDLWWSL